MSVLELIFSLLVIPSTYSNILFSEDNLVDVNERLWPRSANQSCTTYADCIISNSECFEGYCRCPVSFIIDGTLTKCLKVAISYNDECEESIQCSQFLKAGGICTNRTCNCKDGYHYLHGECHLSKGLNEDCVRNEDCFVYAEYQAASCVNGFCKCSENFYQRENNTCRRAAKKLGDNCLIDADCSFDKAAKCLSQKCSVESTEVSYESLNYDPMLDLDDENTSATVMIVVGNRCIKKTDCRSLANSHCGLDKKCTCNRAHFWSEELNACVPEIGEKCGSVDEKYKVKYSVCKDEAWTCEADRVNLKSNQDCRKLLKKIGSSCQYREQCQLFGPAAHCVEGQCVCGADTHWLSDEKFCWINKKINEECWSQNDCYSRSPGLQSFCDRSTAGGFCSCPTGSHHSADKGYCISDKPELDSYCEENEDCELDNSYCNDKKCKCQENYIVLDGLCQAGLNAICTADNKCKQSNTTCSEKNVCKCKEHFIASPDNECIPIASFEKECMYDVQCTSVIPNTYCAFNKLPLKDLTDNEYGKCKCIPGYFYNMDSCFKKKWLGEECTKEGECFVESSKSFCRNGRCVCGFDYMQEGNQCRQVNSESTINTYSVFQLVAVIFVLLKML